MAIEAISELSEAHVQDLLELFRGEWWTQGRTLADVRRMLAASDVVIGFCDARSKQLLAFTRVLTDSVYKALILDVIVAPTQRGTGLGRTLLEAVLAHPALRSVRDFELYCRPEVIPFYAQWGFTIDVGDIHFMRLRRNTPADSSPD